ncbi:cysteine proteinase COT44-like [Arachis hypogaea]|uniref:cysteine proteinase COT44-like n=1 Tax=Arachis hypogaea TaxID=3818 RepID=UPI000DEC9828|nr:cysteine proteinase COT44-like [Arachis hypogaea]QHO31480.1 KDEL-tailed cysteine endopeptidase [Arachis hypogaea]
MVEIWGCAGGYIEGALFENGGITSEENYSYNLTTYGRCNTTKEAYKVPQIKGYEMVPPNNETELLRAVANQPVSVAIQANLLDLLHYSSGVFDGVCGTNLNHDDTAIGYGTTENRIDY